MSHTLRNLVTISCALMATSAVAADLDSRIYLTPNITYTLPETNKWGLDDGMGFGVGVGKAVSDHINLELNAGYSSQNFKNGTPGNLDASSLTAGALYIFNRDPSAFSPYILGGIGGIDVRAVTGSKSHFIADVGVGMMKWLNDIALRGDIRYRAIDGKGDPSVGNDWIATVGLMIPLGAKPVPPAPTPAPVPAPAPYVAPPPPPAPAPAPAPKVEEARPVAHTKIVLEGTHFDFDKATLRPTGKLKLDENAKTLNQYPDINIDITGHTDSIGAPKYNMKLSEKRAVTVKKYLESKGIAASRMTTKGFGETKPVASNKTKAGRAENRRVEIEILN